LLGEGDLDDFFLSGEADFLGDSDLFRSGDLECLDFFGDLDLEDLERRGDLDLDLDLLLYG